MLNCCGKLTDVVDLPQLQEVVLPPAYQSHPKAETLLEFFKHYQSFITQP
jgi:hypothetical protein